MVLTCLDTVPEFISQRRRWLNGAFFAAVYSIVNGKQIWKTDHTFARKILLQIESFYQILNLLFTYFGLVCPRPFYFDVDMLICTGKLLLGILLHRWLPLRQEDRSIRSQCGQVYLHSATIRVYPGYVSTIHHFDG